MNNNINNKSPRRSQRQRDKRKREESNSSNNNTNEHNSSSRQRRGNTTNNGSISNPQQPPQQSTTTSSVKHDSTNQQHFTRHENESLLAYIKRICVPQVRTHMCFFTSARNKHQQTAFDKYKELCRKDLVTLSNDGGAQLPTNDGGVSGLSPVVHRTRGSGQVYLKAKPGTDFVDPENDKFGSITITAAQKNKLYEKKEEEGSFVLLGLMDHDSLSLENARLQRERLNVRNDLMCSIKPEDLQDMTIRDAAGLEWKEGSFNAQLQRHSMIYTAEESIFGGAARVCGAAQRTDISDMETAATDEAEKKGIINPNLRQHPHEHLDGNIGAVLHGGRTVQREKSAYIRSLPPKEQESIRSGEVQPISCSSWSPDLPFPELGLTFILMGCILHQKNSDNVLHNFGHQVDGRSWGDAFGSNHPISRECAKLEKKKSIYDGTLFDDDARWQAVTVIILFIEYIVEHGGWLYMDTNEEALKVLGGISMIEFIIDLYRGTDHPWTVEWEFTFGDTMLTMDKGDGKVRKIDVHRPPCWQGSIAPDVNLDIHAPSMWKCALSNYFRCSLTGTVKTSYATIDEAIGSEDAILEEKVMGNILMAAHHFLWLAMNAHYTLMAASAVSKNLLETERNILLSKFHDPSAGGGVLMNGLTDLFGHSIRKKDKRDRAKNIIEQSTLHITVFKSSKDAKLGLDIKKAEEGASLRVTSIDAGSLFEDSELKVGMMIQSINERTFTSFKDGVALLKEAEGACKVMVFNPLEVSDEDLALVKWYKDGLAQTLERSQLR